jgi:hypothetical protein
VVGANLVSLPWFQWAHVFSACSILRHVELQRSVAASTVLIHRSKTCLQEASKCSNPPNGSTSRCHDRHVQVENLGVMPTPTYRTYVGNAVPLCRSGGRNQVWQAPSCAWQYTCSKTDWAESRWSSTTFPGANIHWTRQARALSQCLQQLRQGQQPTLYIERVHPASASVLGWSPDIRRSQCLLFACVGSKLQPQNLPPP